LLPLYYEYKTTSLKVGDAATKFAIGMGFILYRTEAFNRVNAAMVLNKHS
jgi:hypothetical protein